MLAGRGAPGGDAWRGQGREDRSLAEISQPLGFSSSARRSERLSDDWPWGEATPEEFEGGKGSLGAGRFIDYIAPTLARDNPAQIDATKDALRRSSRGANSQRQRLRAAVRHSDRNTTVVLVCAASRPGIAAIALAKNKAPIAMRTMESAGTVGSGTAQIPLANSDQSHRPRAMPRGMPITNPMTTEAEDCQATVAWSWRLVNPSAFKDVRAISRGPRS